MKRIYLIFVTIFCVIFMIFFSHRIDNYNNYKKLQNEFEKNPVNFWLDKLNTTDYKKIVMDLDKINKFNQDIIENVEDIIDFNSYDEKISVKILKKMITDTEYINNLSDINYLNINDFQSNEVDISYAVAIKKTNLRIIPTDFKVFDYNDQFFYFDNIQLKEVKYGEPLIVLHYTNDKKWIFVQTYNMYGWIKAEDLAFIKNKKEFLDYVNMENFIVVTAKKLEIDNNFLDMGVKIKLKNDEDLYYNVLLPKKDENNRLIYSDYKIEKNEDISKGFVDYTRFNVIKQAFRYYGNDYGWGGLNNGIDCSGLINNIYSVFGFQFPRNSKQQQAMVGDFILFEENTNIFKKSSKLNNTPAGSLLYIKGHIMIYLGKIGKKYYVINSIASYLKNKKPFYSMKVEISDLSYKRKNNRTFLESLLSITEVDY